MPQSLLGEKSRTKGIAQRVQNIEISAIKEMPMLVARDVPDAIRLDQGIPSFRVPRFIRDYTAKAMLTMHSIGEYSQQPGMPELRDAIAGDLERRYSVEVDPRKEVFVSAGSIEALDCTARTLLDPGDEAVLFSPAYEPHRNQILLSDGIPVYAPLDEKRGWRPDIEALKNKITERTKLIYICNPANPTGTVWRKEELDAVADLVKQRKAGGQEIIIVADEAYDFLTYGVPFVSMLSYFPEMKENLVVCHTFSKRLAMTGWRIGYAVADEGIMQHLLKPHDAAAICAPVHSQVAVLHALENPEKTGRFVRYAREQLKRRRDLIYEGLSQLPDVFHLSRPEGAYYVFPRILPEFPQVDSYDFCRALLYGGKVSGVPGDAFGLGGENHLRFMFGAPERKIMEACDRTNRWVSSKEFATYMNSLRK